MLAGNSWTTSPQSAILDRPSPAPFLEPNMVDQVAEDSINYSVNISAMSDQAALSHKFLGEWALSTVFM